MRSGELLSSDLYYFEEDRKWLSIESLLAPDEGRAGEIEEERRTLEFKTLFAIILSAVMLILGLYHTDRGISAIWAAANSPHWPTATALIEGAQVKRQHGRMEFFSPLIDYAFLVNGRKFLSSEVAPGIDSYFSRDSALAVVRKYPVDSNATVYYNPNDPSESLLEPGMTLRSWQRLVYGTLFLNFSIFLGIGTYSAWKCGSFKQSMSKGSPSRGILLVGWALATVQLGLGIFLSL